LADQKHWFARRFPVGHPRNAMAPVSPEGWWVVAVFVAATVIGFAALLVLGMNGQLVSGIVLFVLLALGSGGMFVGMSSRKGDKQRPVDDYKAGRVG
jgi:hypothetical protein